MSNIYTKNGQEIKLTVEFEKAIEYITNVVKCQERFLEPSELFNAYISMNWKKPLGENEFYEAYLCVIKAVQELSEVLQIKIP